MNLRLKKRSTGACELCKSSQEISVYPVPPLGYTDNEIIVCANCLAQIERKHEMDSNYWRFLSEAMWSEVPQYRWLFGACLAV